LWALLPFANAFPHRCNHKKRERERCIICHHKIHLFFCNFVGFHKSSASKKDMYLPPALLIPLFLAEHQCHNFFQAEKKMYSIIFSTISKIIATVLSDEQSSTKISSQFS
jgi:hypothetical protein